MGARTASPLGLALIVCTLGVLACNANTFVNLINNNNPTGNQVIEVVGPSPTPPPAAFDVLPCLGMNVPGKTFYVCAFVAEFKQAAKSTFYTITAKPKAYGERLSYRWSNTNTCGKFIPGTGAMADTAEWHHPDSPDGDCLEQAVHPGIISVDIVSPNGEALTCKYDDGSASGTADPWTINAAFHCDLH
jgi:hypothetical protein